MFHDELFQTKEPKTFQVSTVKLAFLIDGKEEGVSLRTSTDTFNYLLIQSLPISLS